MWSETWVPWHKNFALGPNQSTRFIWQAMGGFQDAAVVSEAD